MPRSILIDLDSSASGIAAQVMGSRWVKGSTVGSRA
jgi:hypothetical protein